MVPASPAYVLTRTHVPICIYGYVFVCVLHVCVCVCVSVNGDSVQNRTKKEKIELIHFGKRLLKQPHALHTGDTLTTPDDIIELRIIIDNNLNWNALIYPG